MIKRIAVVEWWPGDGVAKAIVIELTRMGLEPVLFPFDGAIPNNVDMVLTFAPYGRLLPIASQMAHFDQEKRPVYVHWSNQCQPNPKIPWVITKQIASFRSWVGGLNNSPRAADRFLASLKPVQWLQKRMVRFLILGDIHYAYSKGWLDILCEASNLYARQDIAHGIPAIFVPWGTFEDYYADLQLERDIDVLWFGKRRTKRRTKLLDAIRSELRIHGVEIYVVDGDEKPFIYGDQRTKILNQSKITLSLRNYPYDYTIPPRFHMVAGNRCLLVCEPELDHHPQAKTGKHFIAAEANQLVEQILYYLRHEKERDQITENAYRLVTQELTMANSLKAIVQAAENKIANRGRSTKSSQQPVGSNIPELVHQHT
jgi:hypothetical protein